jgi:hypothetical protein
MKGIGQKSKNKFGNHQSGSKSPRNVQKATAIKPAHDVSANDKRASARHEARPRFHCNKDHNPTTLAIMSIGKNDQFHATNTGLS